MSIAAKAIAGAALVAAQLGSLSVAGAADMLIIDNGYVGPCAEQRFLSKISRRFDYQVHHVPNLPDVSILEYHNIRETRHLPQSEDWPIPRTYCEATVVLSDGYKRDLWYLIEGGMGFAGIGDNVEFCVAGFDRWYVYNGGCRVLR